MLGSNDHGPLPARTAGLVAPNRRAPAPSNDREMDEEGEVVFGFFNPEAKTKKNMSIEVIESQIT